MKSIVLQDDNLKQYEQIDYSIIKKAFLNSLDVSEFSKKLYEKNLDRFFTYLNTLKITMPKREDVIQYKKYLLQEKKPATVNTYCVPLYLFFKFTSDTNLYPNIMTGIKKVKDRETYKKSALSALQIKRLLSHIAAREDAAAARDYCMIQLMLRTGLRDIEIVRADIGDIDSMSGQTVLYIWGKGRESKDNFVVLTEDLYEILLDYLKTRNYPNENEPLFTSLSPKNKNCRLTTRSVSRIVKNSLRGCGLDSSKLTAHSLRHTAVTLSLLAGASIQDAQAMARHANIKTTMTYAHNLDRLKNAAENKVDQFLKSL